MLCTPLIANVLYLSTYLEKWGSGVVRIIEACKEQGVPEPIYEDRGGFIHIIFKRKSVIQSNDTKKLGKKSNSDRLKQIIDILRSNNTITTEELSTMLSVSKSTILRGIKFLKTQITLTWVGPKVGGHWEIEE